MTKTFEIKFAEKHLGGFVDTITTNVRDNPKDQYLFDCTNIEWISNEELLVLTSLLRYFVKLGINFQVLFIKPGTSISNIPVRVAKQVIQIWEVWQIGKVLETQDYIEHFGLDFSTINALKKEFKYYPITTEIYSRYGITPFIILEKIDEYNDSAIDKLLSDIYKLNKATQEVVLRYKCEHPFVHFTLSHIISKELYENFLDHFSTGIFEKTQDAAFMSLSLRTMLNEEKYGKKSIQEILKANFVSEAIPEAHSFYYDEKRDEFKNQSLIEFSFVDFGQGITKSLFDAYIEAFPQQGLFEVDESEVLKYAFRHDTSRFSFSKRNINPGKFIPRGLFDVLSIVRRYQGLIMVRSNYGKILFNFSNSNDFEAAFSKFGDKRHFFPGTLITIYIPAGKILDDFDTSSITPVVNENKYRASEIGYINLYSIINIIKSEKKDLYDVLIDRIRKRLPKDEHTHTIFFSFRGYEYDSRLAKKVIWFLLADYEINIKHNVIIVHPPPVQIIEEIKGELLNLNLVTKNYRVHPLPIVYLESKPQNLKLYWLGVFDEEDQEKLNALLFEQFSLSKESFNDPSNLLGHINYFDSFSNLHSYLPDREKILAYYAFGYSKSDEIEVQNLILKNECLFPKKENRLFLCHSNYYQYEFFEIIHLLNNVKDRNLITEILFLRIKHMYEVTIEYIYIGITSSSHRILSSMIEQNFINEKDVIFLDNYFSFSTDEKLSKIITGRKCILICDIIATGNLAIRIDEKMKQNEAELCFIAVLVSTIDVSFENSKDFVNNFRDRLIILHHYSIPKYRITDKIVRSYLKNNNPVRVNPFTNVSINLSINETGYETILLTNEEFLEEINEDDLKLGYLKFNNMVHPYFFETKNIITKSNNGFIQKIFNKIKIASKDLNVFYPKDSGIRFMDFEYLSNQVFKDHSVNYYELERFNTTAGWKFPHSTDYFIELNHSKTILLMDDGSCSGDSLIQMIDEIAFSNVKEIIVLCLIGRITDHRREFFSRVSNINVKERFTAKISIFFGSHWHIPTYYLEENPNTKEKAWLERIIALPNTPEAIKLVANTVLTAITPKNIDDFQDYKYIPHLKELGKGVPKKELILARDHVGKIVEYRFYKESFEFYDNIIRTFESEPVHRNLELLCATFLYEPYLYPKVKKVLPDIIDKIQSFITNIIFNTDEQPEESVDSRLFYRWDKKDVVHLFFIVYKGNHLLEKLSEIKSLKKLIEYLGESEGSINYILYKTLIYFPLNNKELPNENIGAFLHIVDILLLEQSLKPKFLSSIKIFRSFVSTLPTSKGYLAALASISQEYRDMKDSERHNESVLANYDRMEVDLLAFENGYDHLMKHDFLHSWQRVSSFIEMLLSFSRSYPSFFLNKLHIIEGESESSLRSIHGQLNELINNINETSDFKRIQELVTGFKSKCLSTSSHLAKIFREISTTNAVNRITNFFRGDENNSNHIEIHSDIQENLTIDIPYYILTEMILKEINTNFRHRDTEKKVLISLRNQAGKLIVRFINDIATAPISKGGGYGLLLLNKVNEFPNEIIKYSGPSASDVNPFIQEIQIKIA